MNIIINPSFQHLDDFIRRLPDTFDTEGETIYNGRNLLKRYHVQGVDLVVKSFKTPILVNRFAYTYIRKSKALRSFEYAFEILRRGCRTAEPIACIEEYRGGMLNKSYYISVYEKDMDTVRQYMEGEVKNKEEMLAAFTQFTAYIHKSGIYHIDYSPGNVLMGRKDDGSYYFSLIDINRLMFRKIDEKAAYHNLERLCSSQEVSSWIAREYARINNFNPDKAEMMVNRYSDRFFSRKMYAFAKHDIERSYGMVKSLFGPLQLYGLLWLIRKHFHCDLFYEKEKELYRSWMEVCDLRRVRSKEYLQ